MDLQNDIEKALIYKALNFLETEPEILTLSTEHFNEVIISELYGIILKLAKEGQKINLLSLHTYLQKNLPGQHDKINNLLICASACEVTVTTLQTSYIIRYLREFYIKKIILNEISQIQIQCLGSQYEVTDVLKSLSKIENEAYNEIGKTGNLRHLNEFVCESVLQSKERAANYEKGVQNGLSSGITELDDLLCNFQNKELIIIAGRPAMGKTAIALIMAKHIAKSAGVGLFELEMSGTRLADRLILSETDINSEKFKKGNLSTYDFQQIDRAKNTLSKLNFYVDDKASQSIYDVRSKCAIMVKKGLLNIIVIDYLGLMETDQAKGKTREREVAEITRQAKIMAKDFDLPVILLCQLSRPERGRIGAPHLTDLRDSGAIEQDADVVIFIHRPEYYNPEAEKNLVELHTAKNRNGQIGVSKCYKNDNFTKLIEPIDENLKAFGMPVNEEFEHNPF